MPRKHWRDNYDFISWQQFGRIGTKADPAKSLFQSALSCVLMSREKRGWILYQITALASMRVKPMILSLGQLPTMMCTARLPSIPLVC